MKRDFKVWVVTTLLSALALLVAVASCAGTKPVTNSTSTTSAGATAVVSPASASSAVVPAAGGYSVDDYRSEASSGAAFALRIPANGKSLACEDNGTLPLEYTCYGSGQSPPLEWSGEPVGTKEFCLILWHKSTGEAGGPPGIPRYYWILYNIPANIHSIPVGNPGKIGKIGLNDQNSYEYKPTCSSQPGLLTYSFNLYALDDSPQFSQSLPKKADGSYEGVNRDVLLEAIKNVTLAIAVCRANTDQGNR